MTGGPIDFYRLEGGQTYTFTKTLTTPAGSSNCNSFVNTLQIPPVTSCQSSVTFPATSGCAAQLSESQLQAGIEFLSNPGDFSGNSSALAKVAKEVVPANVRICSDAGVRQRIRYALQILTLPKLSLEAHCLQRLL